MCLEQNVYRLSYVPSNKDGMCFEPGVWNDHLVITNFGITQPYCKAEGTSSHLACVRTIVGFCFVKSHAENSC